MRAFTRRQFIFTAGLVAGGEILPWGEDKRCAYASAAPSQDAIFGSSPFVSSLGTHVVTVLPSTDPSFDLAVEANFSGLKSVDGYETALPGLALVRNTGQHPVLAYLIRWSITPAGGPTTYFDTEVIQRAGELHKNILKSAASGTDIVLKAGKSHLVSPVFSWSTRYYRSLKSGYVSNRLRSVFVREFNSGDLVQLSLDGVVFTDSTFLGPNESLLFERFMLERNAQHDGGISVRRMLKQGMSDDEIQNALKGPLVKDQGLLGDTSRGGFYCAERVGQAQRLAGILQEYGHDQLVAVAGKLRNLPRTVLTKLDA